jgi:hypothetical protein
VFQPQHVLPPFAYAWYTAITCAMNRIRTVAVDRVANNKGTHQILPVELHDSISLRKLVYIALRDRVLEQQRQTSLSYRARYEELKQELGLGHFEGGTAAGFIIMQLCRSTTYLKLHWIACPVPLSLFVASAVQSSTIRDSSLG